MSEVIDEKNKLLVRFEKVSYVYMKDSPFETIALNNIDLHIGSGEFIGIVGHTGSGKTTLVQHINALLKPSEGKVIVKEFDTNVDKAKLNDLRKSVGLVFQYPEYQLFEETVTKDVGYGPNNLGLDEEEVKRRVEKAIHQVGLDIDEVGEKSPFELSGGQRRRIAFAGVLAMEPDVLILDEPTAGLDPQGRKEVLSLLRQLRCESNITIIMISHYMDEIANVASRIIVMAQGKIVMDDVPRKIFNRYSELVDLGLDVPYTVKLTSELKKRGINVDKTIITLSEMRDFIVELKGGNNV